MNIDEKAYRAAEELRERVSAEVHLRPRDHPRRSRAIGSVVAVAAAVVTVLGLVAVTTGGDGTGDTRFEVTELDLSPLAPNDGRGSQRLPVSIEPGTDLIDGQAVTLTGEGHVPGDELGIVMCSATAETRGIDGCQISTVGYVTADADGSFATDYAVRRSIDVPSEGAVDCSEYAERCLVGVGALSNYDRSGGVALTFAGSGPLPPAAELSAEPLTGLTNGQDVRLTGNGFVPGTRVFVVQCGGDVGCQAIPQPEEVRAGETGSVELTAQVARYLPGLSRSAGDDHYDCVQYACSVQLRGETGTLRAAPSVPVTFDPAGPTSPLPTLSVSPAIELQPGDVLTVSGSGFQTGTSVTLALCGEAREGDYGRCFVVNGSGSETHRFVVDESGSFALALAAPSVLEPVRSTDPGTGDVIDEGAPSDPIDCRAAEGACAVWAYVEAGFGELPALRPQPVPLQFGSS